MNQDQLLSHRIAASLASKGTSSGVIHEKALAACGDRLLNGDLLEYGAGTGEILQQLSQMKRTGRMVGADLMPRPEGLAQEIDWIEADLNDSLKVASASFDLVLSTEVIEHLENPRAMARELARLLKPGGRVVVTTPNQESLRSLLSVLINGHFVAFLDASYPAHITALLRKDLVRIFAEAGFGKFVFSFTNCGGIPKRPAVTWQQISGNLLKGRWFSDNVVMSAELLPP